MNIDETRFFVYSRDGWRCKYIDKGVRCRNMNSLQMAHILSRSLFNHMRIKRIWFKLFGETITSAQATKILNHPLNLITSCSEHNQLFLRDIGDSYITEFLKENEKELRDEIRKNN